MAKGWRRSGFEMTQTEVAEVLGTSQQNVNDAERKAFAKLREAFLNFYTLREIRDYLRFLENSRDVTQYVYGVDELGYPSGSYREMGVFLGKILEGG